MAKGGDADADDKWWTASFAMREMGRGALQAVGSAAFWVLLIVWIIHSGWGSKYLDKVLEVKYPTLTAVS